MALDIQAVKMCPRFAGISEEASQWLASRMNRRVFKKKMPIFFEEESCRHLFIIERGSVKVFKTLDSGRELILNIFGLGEAIGEVALIDEDCFPASAVANEETFLLELSKESYFEMGRLFPEVLYSTIRDLTQRVRVMTRRIHELGSGNVDAKLAQVFLSLSLSATRREGGCFIAFSISRQELADLIGARIETVIRTMSRWQKLGLVQTEQDGFNIPKLSDLQQIIRDQSS